MSKIISRWDACAAVIASEDAGKDKLALCQLTTILKAIRREEKRGLIDYLDYLEINNREERFFPSLKSYTLDEIMANTIEED